MRLWPWFFGISITLKNPAQGFILFIVYYFLLVFKFVFNTFSTFRSVRNYYTDFSKSSHLGSDIATKLYFYNMPSFNVQIAKSKLNFLRSRSIEALTILLYFPLSFPVLRLYYLHRLRYFKFYST